MKRDSCSQRSWNLSQMSVLTSSKWVYLTIQWLIPGLLLFATWLVVKDLRKIKIILTLNPRSSQSGYEEPYQKMGVQIFHLLVHFINGHSDWRWTRLKPGAQGSTWESHLVAGTQLLKPSSAAFSGTPAASWITSGAGWTWTSTTVGYGSIAGSSLAHHATSF